MSFLKAVHALKPRVESHLRSFAKLAMWQEGLQAEKGAARKGLRDEEVGMTYASSAMPCHKSKAGLPIPFHTCTHVSLKT